jgi:hypothetical protein
VTRKPNNRLKGKWRIVETKLWDRNYLDLVEPAYIAVDGKGRGEFAFGALNATLDCAFTQSGIDFRWCGFDEMDEITGDGWAELEPDGSLTGEISFHNGDETTFHARPW